MICMHIAAAFNNLISIIRFTRVRQRVGYNLNIKMDIPDILYFKARANPLGVRATGVQG